MKYFFASVLPLLLLLSVFSCKPEDEIYSKDSGMRLQFSTDTVAFDTVFVAAGSVTKRLKVYNPSKNAVKIDEIKIGKLGLSAFSLIIDGDLKPMATNFTLRGEDSLLILVKAYIDPNNQQNAFIVEDEITFRMNGNEQKVRVEAFGQNANYFKNIEFCGGTWTDEKPYVLYGPVIVKAGCTLTIKPGTKIYAHPGAGLLVYGTLKVEGTKGKGIKFQHDRRDTLYADIPGQWYGIAILENSDNNSIQYAEIKNSLFGVNIQNKFPNLTTIKNCVIRNCFSAGLLGVMSNFEVENTLITNCGQYAAAGVGGGNYRFNHCTFANFTPEFKRETEAFAFNDSVLLEDGLHINDSYVELKNSIVWNGNRNGELTDELLFLTLDGLQNITITNSLLQSQRYENEAKFTNPAAGNIFNTDPEFAKVNDGSVLTKNIKYTLKDTSPAIGKAASSSVNIDLPGEARPQGALNPDMGAYENAK